jgi:hypothetical protein
MLQPHRSLLILTLLALLAGMLPPEGGPAAAADRPALANPAPEQAASTPDAGAPVAQAPAPAPRVPVDSTPAPVSPAPIAATPSSAVPTTSLDALPLSFIPNAGQTDPQVRFHAQGLGGNLFFTQQSVMLALPLRDPAARRLRRPTAVLSATQAVSLTVARLRFDGPNPTPVIDPVDRLPGVASFYLGNDPRRWQTNLTTYAGLVYRELYPGIDLRYDGVGGQLKSTYLVAPGADPRHIRWRYQGAVNYSLESGHDP